MKLTTSQQYFFDLYCTAKKQLENFNEDVIIARGCNVKGRSPEENERCARLLCTNVVNNISAWFKTHHNLDPEEILKDSEL